LSPVVDRETSPAAAQDSSSTVVSLPPVERYQPFVCDDLSYTHFPAGSATNLPSGSNPIGFSSVHGILRTNSSQARHAIENFNLLWDILMQEGQAMQFLDQIKLMFGSEHPIHQLAISQWNLHLGRSLTN
jgi:hypothetical protein